MANELFNFMGKIEIKMDEAQKSIDNITNQAEEKTGKITGFFKNAAIAIGAAFAIDKVIDFGKMAVNAAAEAEALEAQFEQVFGSLQDEANDMIDGMAGEFGMLPERIMPGFTQLTSMFKGVGMASEDAMATAEQATMAAADAAAFYDTSMENAQSSIASFVKGNYEAGESIGIFANDAQMAQFAIENGVVSSTAEWQKLDEATKQATRVEYIRNMQEQSGAMGQASREADGFENVMGNLKAAWKKFLAVVGGPILKAVIPIIKGITDGVVWLAEVLGPVMDGIKEWLSPITEVENGFTGMFSGIGDSVKDLLSIFDTVKTAIEVIMGVLFGNQSTGEAVDLMEQLGMSDGTIGTILAIIDVLKVAIEGLSDYWDVMKKASEWAWNAIMDVAKLAIDFYSTYLKAIFSSISKWWTENQDTILSTVKLVWDTIVETLEFIFGIIQGVFYAVWEPLSAWFSENQELIQSTVETVWNAILAGIKFVMEKIVPAIIDRWNSIMEFLGPILSAIYALISTVMSYILGIIKAIMQAINGDWSGAWQTIKDTVNTFLSSAREIVFNLLTRMWNIVKEKAKDMFDAIKEWFGKIPGKIEELWGQAQSFLEGINLWSIGESIIQGLWDGIKGKWDSMVDWVSGKAEGITDTLKGVFQINSPAKVMIPIGSALPEGVALGVDKGAKFVDRALNKLGSKVANTAFNVPEVAMASDYTFKPQPTQAQRDSNNLLEEAVYLLRKILDKDTKININGRTLSEEILEDINYLNDLYGNRNVRIMGGVAYP